MPDSVYDKPPDLFRFVTMEYEQFLISISTTQDSLATINHIQGLYGAALSGVKIKNNGDLIVYRLLTFVHYHFLFSTACLLRCHLSEAFSSLRSALDGALVAAYIIHDRSAQTAYFNRSKPFDKLIRHYRNFLGRPEKLPHPHVPTLVSLHDACSRFASHADIDAFAHRRREFRDKKGTAWATTEYFQFSRDAREQRYYFSTLMHGFLIMLDVFSAFLVDEQKKVPDEWRSELHGAIADIEKVRDSTGPAESS